MSKRIHIDNQHAKEFAEIVAKYDFVDIDLKLVHTNIVRFKLKGHSQPEFIKNLATERIIPIKCLEVSGGFIRLESLKYAYFCINILLFTSAIGSSLLACQTFCKTFHCDAADKEDIQKGKEKLISVLDQMK